MDIQIKEAPNYQPLESVEDVEEYYQAIRREKLTHKLSPERPYCYWTIETYDKSNGIRGGGGLGVLAADMRRVAEQLQVPFVLVTPFYPWESHQKMLNMEQIDYHVEKDYKDFGFNFVDTVRIKTATTAVELDVIEKKLGSSRFLCITEFRRALFRRKRLRPSSLSRGCSRFWRLSSAEGRWPTSSRYSIK